jgi:hypothetical protein
MGILAIFGMPKDLLVNLEATRGSFCNFVEASCDHRGFQQNQEYCIIFLGFEEPCCKFLEAI